MADRAIFPSGRCWAGVPCAVHRGCTLSKRNTWNRTWQWGAKWEDKMFPELWGHIFDKVPLLVSFWSEDFTMTTVLHIILETWNRKSTYNTSIAYIHIYMYDVYILVDPHFYGDLIVFIGYPKTSAVCFNNRLGPGRPWMPHCFNGQTLRPGRWMDDSIPIGSMGLGMLVYPPWNINSQFRTWKIWKWMVGILNSFLFGKAHSISKTTVPYSWIYNIIYIYMPRILY